MELKLYRRMNGLTQEQVADYLGIPSWSGGMTTVPTLRSSPMTSVTSLTHIEG